MQADDLSSEPVTPRPAPVVDNHWLRKLTGSKKVKVTLQRNLKLKIVGTTPSQGNQGFWRGALEGQVGRYSGYTGGGDVIMLLAAREQGGPAWEVDVPKQYVQPQGPDAKFQNVIVIDEGSKLYGKHFNILGEHGPGVWKLTPLHSKFTGQDRHQVHTDHLVRY